jgi:hypothetical protein
VKSEVKDKLAKRARRKYLNTPLLRHLLALDSPLKDKYAQTLTCSHAIRQIDGKVQSRYCKRTWCNICSPIRTAIRINTYRKSLESLQDLQFTTLTAPNCNASEIRSTIQHFRAVFRQFRNTYKKQTGLVFKGVYNFECTYNHRTGLYHPHIHIIHEGLELEPTGLTRKDGEPQTVNSLVRYWLKKNTSSSVAAQDARPCTDLIEGFKYQSLSIFKIKINGKKQPFVPVAELDVLYQQLTGLRCFQSFGLEVESLSEEEEEKAFENLTAYESDKPDAVYVWNVHDWITPDQDTGEAINLTDFQPTKQVTDLYDKLTSNHHYHRAKHSLPPG